MVRLICVCLRLCSVCLISDCIKLLPKSSTKKNIIIDILIAVMHVRQTFPKYLYHVCKLKIKDNCPANMTSAVAL